MMNKDKKNTVRRNKGPARLNGVSRSGGFTLLFASLVAALVIAVGAAILGITMKQITLSAAGKATQQAFYSADAGVECALYLDRGAGLQNCRLGFFPSPTTTDSSTIHQGAGSCVDNDVHLLESARCLGKYLGDEINSNVYVDPVTRDVTTNFTLDNDTPDSEDAILPNATIIESRGYNTCNPNAVNRFERAIRSINQ
jgi:type II secretory pathway pseudopilin PulG